MGRAPAPKERGIEATLKDLNILGGDDGPTPEPKDEMRLPPVDDGDEDGGGDGDGDGDSGPGMAFGGFDAEEGGTPFPSVDRPPPLSPALVPSPAVPKGRPRKNTAPAGGRLHKSLAEKVPHADKVKVYKRIDGRRFFVGDYSRNDLQQFTDFESFLARYVKSVHGAGEYDLVGVDGLSRETELGQIRFLPDPTKQSPEASAIALAERVMQEQRERDEEWRKTTSANQLNPLELLTGVMALKEKIDSEASGGLSAAMKAMSESNAQTTQLMLAMMQQNQQTMMALLTKPKEEDPTLKLLLTKLLADQSGGGAAMPPPPPPPSPTSGLAEVLTAMAAFMSSMGGGGGDDEFKEFLKTLLPTLLNKNDGLGTKEVLELVLSNKKNGGDEFRSAIDNMAAIMNVAQNINRGGEPGAAAGFFDALAALFSNRDFAGSIAQTIRAKTDATKGSEEARLAAEKQRLAMERRLLQQERARLGGGSAPPAQPQPQPQPQVSQERVQEAAQRTVQRTGRIPELPGNTYEHINNIVNAKDEGEMVGKTIAMLIYFAEFEDWRQFSERLLTNVRDGNKTEAMRYLTAFFEGLAAIGMLQNEQVPQITSVIARHFSTVQEQLTELSTEADKQITAEKLVEPPPDAAAEAVA